MKRKIMLGMSYQSDFDNNLVRTQQSGVSAVDNVTVEDFLADGVLADGLEASGKIVSSIDANGNFIKQLLSDTLNTQSKQILGEYTFGSSGAIAIKTDENNGVWLSPSGILGKKAGNISFAIEVDGDASFGGSLLGASGTFGTITSGTLTGCTFNANGGSGTDVSIGNDGCLRFKYGGSNKAFIAVDLSGNMYIDSDAFILMQANGGAYITYNEDGGSDSFTVFNDNTVAMNLDDGLSLTVEKDIMTNSGTFRSNDGSGGTSASSIGFVTAIDFTNKKAKWRTLTFKNGICTNVGNETGWM